MKSIYQHRVKTNWLDANGRPYVATLCAVRVGDKVLIGSAMCSPCDQYKRKEGRDLALERALEGELQEGIEYRDFHDFHYRALRYFKDVPAQNFEWKEV